MLGALQYMPVGWAVARSRWQSCSRRHLAYWQKQEPKPCGARRSLAFCATPLLTQIFSPCLYCQSPSEKKVFKMGIQVVWEVANSHYQDDELCVGVVSVPGCSQWLLSPQVPHHKMDVVPDNLLSIKWDDDNVLASHLLHIAAYGGGRVNHLVHQELIENRGLPCVIQTNQANLVLWQKERGSDKTQAFMKY